MMTMTMTTAGPVQVQQAARCPGSRSSTTRPSGRIRYCRWYETRARGEVVRGLEGEAGVVGRSAVDTLMAVRGHGSLKTLTECVD